MCASLSSNYPLAINKFNQNIGRKANSKPAKQFLITIDLQLIIGVYYAIFIACFVELFADTLKSNGRCLRQLICRQDDGLLSDAYRDRFGKFLSSKPNLP